MKKDVKPKVRLSRRGSTYAALGACFRAAKAAGWSDQRWRRIRKELSFGDAETVVTTAQRYFDVELVD